MSYVDQAISRGRVYAIVIVAILHALLAYAFVTGLAYRFVKGREPGHEDLRREGGAAAPARGAAAPAAGPAAARRRSTARAVAVPAAVADAGAADAARDAAPPPVTLAPPAPPAPPPPPPPPRVVPPQRARANLDSYFSADDYPAAALRGNEQGTTGFRLTDRPQRPRDRLLGDLLERLVRARSGDLPDPAQPGPLHARARRAAGNPTTRQGFRPGHLAASVRVIFNRLLTISE